jgi:hypothetical protein
MTFGIAPATGRAKPTASGLIQILSGSENSSVSLEGLGARSNEAVRGALFRHRREKLATVRRFNQAEIRPVCLTWKWRERSSVKIAEPTYEEGTETLHRRREGGHF